MSKTIVNDHLWTPEEVEYQLARDLRDEVAVNRRTYGAGGSREGKDDSDVDNDDGESLNLDKDIYDKVVALDVDGLKKELAALDLSDKGDEQDLRIRLAKKLQADKDANANQ